MATGTEPLIVGISAAGPVGAYGAQGIGLPEWGDASQMFTISQTLLQGTINFVEGLSGIASGIFAPVINPSFPSIATPPVPITASLPSLEVVSWVVPAQPAAFSGNLSVTNIMPGPFQGVAPTLSFGQAPAAFAGVAPPQPSVNTNFNYPTVVSPALPSAPSLLSLSTITFNPLAIPSFNVNVPVLTLVAPGTFNYSEKQFYSSTELSTVQASLISAMTDDCDTGLSGPVQDALWDRQREREYRQQAAALDALTRDSEVLNYAFPPGSFIDGRIKIQTETNYTIAGLGREIMIKQAELRLENVTKARELAVSLEGKLIDYYNQVCQRSFDASKYAVESAIAIYNAQVEMFKGQLEGYRVQSLVYETQIKGIEAQISELRAQIDFEKTKADINEVQVTAYKTQIDAALATLQVYQVETDIIKVQAEVEKLKVDTYSAEIQAFVGTINAYTAQVEAYKAGIEAQATIESAYKTSVDAYSAEVDAATKVIDAQIAEFRAGIDAYTAQLKGYEASLQAMTEQARAASLYNQSEVAVYEGEVRANSAYNESLISEWKAIVDTNERIAEVAVKAAEANGQLYISARQLALHASEVGAQVMSQLGAAALNAIHWSNSSSWSMSAGSSQSSAVSVSTNTSNSTSASTSNSTSTNTNNNFSESA